MRSTANRACSSFQFQPLSLVFLSFTFLFLILLSLFCSLCPPFSLAFHRNPRNPNCRIHDSRFFDSWVQPPKMSFPPKHCALNLRCFELPFPLYGDPSFSRTPFFILIVARSIDPPVYQGIVRLFTLL